MVKLSICVLLLLGLPDFIFSQDQRVIDSLHRRLNEEMGVADQYDALYRLAVEYIDVDNHLALQFITRAERVALVLGDTGLVVTSKRVKGQIYFRLGRIDELVDTYSFILPIAERHQLGIEYVLITNIFGSAFLYQSRFDEALKFFFLSKEMAGKENDLALVGMVLANIGITYYKLKDYRRGLHYLQKSRHYKRESGTLRYDTPLNLSLCYVNLSDFESASKALNESLRLCGQDCSDLSMMHIKYASGSIFLGKQEFRRAEVEFLRSYDLSKEIGDTRMQLDNIYLLSDILIREGRLEEATQYLQDGETIVTQGISYHLEMIKLYARLSELYIKIKDFQKASTYQSKYIILKDSIYSDELTTSLMRIESQYLERENAQKLSDQQEVILLKEQVIGRQFISNIAVGLLGLISIVLVVVLYRNYRRKQHLNFMLENKIRERTTELEYSRNELMMALRERDLLIESVIGNISEATRTIQGLCFTGGKDSLDSKADAYFKNINKTAILIATHVRSIHFKSDLYPG